MSETPPDPNTEGATSARPGPAPASPGRRPRRMRYADRAQGVPVPDDDVAQAMPPDVDGDALGLTAAESLAQEASGAPDDDPSGDDPPAWTDAFTPKADTAQGDTEISSRDERHRQQLREAEAERDRLASLVQSMRRIEIERLASARLADPGDLFRDEASVDDMLTEDGRVDPARVDAAISTVLQQHPHWAAPLARYTGPLRSGSSSVKFEQPGSKFVAAFAPQPTE